MERFGFGEDPPMDYPDAQMRPSGVYDAERNKLIPRGLRQRRHRARRRSARSGCASRRCRWRRSPRRWPTAGMRMEPHLANRVVDQDGRTVERIEPEEAERVMSRRAPPS